MVRKCFPIVRGFKELVYYGFGSELLAVAGDVCGAGVSLSLRELPGRSAPPTPGSPVGLGLFWGDSS